MRLNVAWDADEGAVWVALESSARADGLDDVLELGGWLTPDEARSVAFALTVCAEGLAE